MRSKDLVILSLEPYSEVRRRNGHVINHLLKDFAVNKVLWINPSQRIKQKHYSSRLILTSRLIIYTPIKIVPERFMTLNFYSLYVQLILLRRMKGFRNPIYWLNNLEWFKLPRRSFGSFYDITDDWLVEPNIDKDLLFHRKKREEFVLKKVDVITVCSKELLKRKSSLVPQREYIHIQNGADKELYQKKTNQTNSLWNHLSREAVYIGSLHESRLDIPLVCQIADILNTRQFGVTLIGPNFMSEESRQVLAAHSVTVLKEVSFLEIPEIANSAGVLIVPHLINTFTDSLDPLKLYEYLCSSSPIVSTKVAGFQEFGDQISICSKDKFASKIVDLLESGVRRVPTPNEIPDWKDVAEDFKRVLRRIDDLRSIDS